MRSGIQAYGRGYAIFDRVDAVLQLRQHAAAQASAVYEVLCLFDGHLGNEGTLILKVAVNALYIGQECQLLGVDCTGNGAGCVICVDVIACIVLVRTDRADDRKEIPSLTDRR